MVVLQRRAAVVLGTGAVLEAADAIAEAEAAAAADSIGP